MKSKPNTKENSESNIITADEVARRYKVSRRTVGNWVRSRVLPSVLVGRVRRFDVERVREAMAKFEQKEITR